MDPPDSHDWGERNTEIEQHKCAGCGTTCYDSQYPDGCDCDDCTSVFCCYCAKPANHRMVIVCVYCLENCEYGKRFVLKEEFDNGGGYCEERVPE